MANSLTNSQKQNSRNKPLPLSFYQRDTVAVARDLLGKGFYVRKLGVEFLMKLVEVEAYLGDKDAAAHSFRGPTPRTQMMFEGGGRAYVYLSYGVHWCINVVVGEKGRGHAILLRAGEPLLGVEAMKQNRHTEKEKMLLSGPGKLTQAVGITIDDNGRLFNESDFCLVDLGEKLSARAIVTSKRIGITKAADEPLRFTIKDSLWVSK